MLRKVELFLQKGVVTQKAPLSDGPNDYGRIKIVDALDKSSNNYVEAFTHYRHSFLKDENKNPIQPEVNDVPVYCFLIPMEYLFVDPPGDKDDTPLLAVNVSTTFPYLAGLNDNPKNRHPCTSKTTIAPDSFDSYPASDPGASFLMLPVLFIGSFLNYLFHRNKTYHYGINDYGELTVIETNNKKDAALLPWDKIKLYDPNISHHAWFSHVYSPKRIGSKRDEFKILKQKFEHIDKDWIWKFKKLEDSTGRPQGLGDPTGKPPGLDNPTGRPPDLIV